MKTADYKLIAKKLKFEGTEALNQYLQTKTIWINHS